MVRHGKRLGYIRTSTDRQSPARQIDGLSEVCDAVFVEEGVSATSSHRPVFEDVLSKLKSGDTLVVWDVDRAFRCTSEALTQVDALRARGVSFEAVGWEYDFETPEGVFNFTIRAACAELETGIMSTRIRQGIAAAK
ncbi:MAG: recombinase family protein, partial [Pseudomonadota bacterium]